MYANTTQPNWVPFYVYSFFSFLRYFVIITEMFMPAAGEYYHNYF